MRRITVGASTRHFCYDGNGNQLRGWNFTNGRTRDLTWTPYNLPKTVTENSQTLTFSYGADRSRFKQVNSFSGETRLYVDGIYEKETVGATVTHVHHIVAEGEAVAIYKSRSDGVQQTRYLHRDHLRSVAGVTNESGAVVETYSYDVWGKRRNTDWTDATSQIFAAQTPRGYTGHEQLDHVSLIHMNGRAYDPDVGRMLSPDPFVQFPGYSQSFNRYSYVLNNPLSGTDPSGYAVESMAAGPWGFIVAAIRGIFGRSKMRGRPFTAWEISQARVWTEDDVMGMLLGQDTIDATVPAANGTVYNSTSPPGHSPYSTASADGQGYMGTVWGRAYAANSGVITSPNLRTSLVADPTGVYGQMVCDYVGRSVCEAPAKIFFPDFECIIGIGCTGVEQVTEVVLSVPLLKWLKWLRGATKADNVVGAAEDSASAARGSDSVRSVYGDGTRVYQGQQPPRIEGPDPDAVGPHTVLRRDTVNDRIYQGRTFDANGNPVVDIDHTVPTYPNGTPRPNHPGPPHQHRWEVNDPAVGPRSGHKRLGPEELE